MCVLKCLVGVKWEGTIKMFNGLEKYEIELGIKIMV